MQHRQRLSRTGGQPGIGGGNVYLEKGDVSPAEIIATTSSPASTSPNSCGF